MSGQTPPVAFIRKVKRPVGSGLWPSYAVGSDSFGRWFHTPRHSHYRGENGTRSEVCEVAQDADGTGEHALHLAPTRGWWFATWRRGGFLSADVCIPLVPRGDEWIYVDLELDPFRTADGSVGTEDADELAAAVSAGLIGPAEQRAALHAAERLERAFAEGTEPFGRVGWELLESLVGQRFPPLADFGAHPKIYSAPVGPVTAIPGSTAPEVRQYR